MPTIHRYYVREIPPQERDRAAKAFTDCVDKATAKTTGENQDAEAWVRECGEQVRRIYGETVLGYWDGAEGSGRFYPPPKPSERMGIRVWIDDGQTQAPSAGKEKP
jgi:hypothetical protein